MKSARAEKHIDTQNSNLPKMQNYRNIHATYSQTNTQNAMFSWSDWSGSSVRQSTSFQNTAYKNR